MFSASSSAMRVAWLCSAYRTASRSWPNACTQQHTLTHARKHSAT